MGFFAFHKDAGHAWVHPTIGVKYNKMKFNRTSVCLRLWYFFSFPFTKTRLFQKQLRFPNLRKWDVCRSKSCRPSAIRCNFIDYCSFIYGIWVVLIFSGNHKPLWAELSNGSWPAVHFQYVQMSIWRFHYTPDVFFMQIIFSKGNLLRCRLGMRLCTQNADVKKKTENRVFLFFESRLNCGRVKDDTQENTSRFPSNNINNSDWQPPYRRLSAPTVVEIVNTERSLYGLP